MFWYKSNNMDCLGGRESGLFDKVQLFWEGHKNVCNRPYGFEIYLVNIKTIRPIALIFVAFPEKLHFKVKIVVLLI